MAEEQLSLLGDPPVATATIEPWGFIAHRDGKWTALIANTKDAWVARDVARCVRRGDGIRTVYSREEYEAALKELGD